MIRCKSTLFPFGSKLRLMIVLCSLRTERWRKTANRTEHTAIKLSLAPRWWSWINGAVVECRDLRARQLIPFSHRPRKSGPDKRCQGMLISCNSTSTASIIRQFIFIFGKRKNLDRRKRIIPPLAYQRSQTRFTTSENDIPGLERVAASSRGNLLPSIYVYFMSFK